MIGRSCAFEATFARLQSRVQCVNRMSQPLCVGVEISQPVAPVVPYETFRLWILRVKHIENVGADVTWEVSDFYVRNGGGFADVQRPQNLQIATYYSSFPRGKLELTIQRNKESNNFEFFRKHFYCKNIAILYNIIYNIHIIYGP